MVLFRSALKRLLFFIVIFSTAWLSMQWLHLPAQNWLIITVLLLALPIDDLFNPSIKVMGYLALIASAVLIILGYAGFSFTLTTLLITLITFLCTYIGLRIPKYTYLALIINFLALLSYSQLTQPSQVLLQVFWLLTGVLIVILFRLLYLLVDSRSARFRSWLTTALQHLMKLNEEIFACFLYQEYQDNLYLYERRIHRQKHQYLNSLWQLRKLQRRFKKVDAHKHASSLITALQALHDALIDCGQLRHRVSDATVFSLCAEELYQIDQSIREGFHGLILLMRNKGKLHDGMDRLQMNIKRFEEMYLNVIQVTAREPLVFFLFIASLKNLAECLQNFRTALSQSN